MRKRTLAVVTLTTVSALLAIALLISLREVEEFEFTKGVPQRNLSRLTIYSGLQSRNIQSLIERYSVKAVTYAEPITGLKPRVEEELRGRGFVKEPSRGTDPTAAWNHLGYQADDGSYPEAILVTIMPGHFDDPTGTYTYSNRVSTVVIRGPKQQTGIIQRFLGKLRGFFQP